MRILFALSLPAGFLIAALGSSPVSAGTLNVAIHPVDGGAAIISSSKFQICRRRGIDAWDMRNCPGWRPLGTGVRSYAGFYCVQGWWDNGPQYWQSLDMTVNVSHRDLLIRPQRQQRKVCL